MAIRVGDVGRALSDMFPSGAVEVNGKRIDARSESQPIEAGSTVVVLRGDPTGFVVRKVEPGQAVPKLPGHGTPIRRADFQRNSAEVAEVEREERSAKWKRQLHVFRVVGGGSGLLGALLGFLWQYDTGDAATIAQWSVGGALVFAVVACAVVWVLDKVMGPDA